MELVEGETLAERIFRGPILMDEAIQLFLQIAEGLEAAHGKGIIHRDLKPPNIKIGPNGEIKILDFGLAKFAEAETESAGGGDSHSPTLTKGTALGAIMGTASYMEPRAGARETGRQADGHLGVRMLPLRSPDGKKSLRRRDGHRYPRRRGQDRARLVFDVSRRAVEHRQARSSSTE